MTTAGPPSSYDEVPYLSVAFSQTHPDLLAALATLFGMEPAPVERCRVLELGCASGGNLIPMAAGLPQSRFVGLDLSARQVAQGQVAIQATGLTNIELRHQDIRTAGDDLGRFDYVIAHGVYSWVSADVRELLLELCRRHLNPQGVAFVSYDAYPYGHLRRMVRDLMRYHVRGLTEPLARAARARELLGWLVEAAPAEPNAHQQCLAAEHRRLAPLPDSYLVHDCLAAVNEPLLFRDFAAAAARYGLRYLTEAYFPSTTLTTLPPRLARSLRLLDVVEREQLLDFVRGRAFRQTLLCHREVAVFDEPSPERLTSLFLAASDPSVTAGESPTPDHPLTRAALACLAESWPRWLSFEALQAGARARLAGGAIRVQEPRGYAQDSRKLADALLRGFASGKVLLRASAPRFVAQVSARPRASAVARFEAAAGSIVTSMAHGRVNLDRACARLLAHLDGRHDRAALVEVLASAVASGELSLDRDGAPVADPDELRAFLPAQVDAYLTHLARAALLIE